MRFSRLFLPLFCVAALLFAQQAGAAHALSHALEQQQEKHAPNSPACEKCENYAQLGNALGTGTIHFALAEVASGPVFHLPSAFHSSRTFAAAARAPPVLPQTHA